MFLLIISPKAVQGTASKVCFSMLVGFSSKLSINTAAPEAESGLIYTSTWHPTLKADLILSINYINYFTFLLLRYMQVFLSPFSSSSSYSHALSLFTRSLNVRNKNYLSSLGWRHAHTHFPFFHSLFPLDLQISGTGRHLVFSRGDQLAVLSRSRPSTSPCGPSLCCSYTDNSYTRGEMPV